MDGYPDASVVCDELELDPDDPKGHTILNPRVVVEVLSPPTEEYDRGEKLEHYQRIDSLSEIVLVAHDREHVELWRREGEHWVRSEAGPGGSLELRALGCAMSVAEIYRNPLG